MAMPFRVASTAAEYRDGAPFPALILEDGQINQHFSQAFEAWFSDHFGFRELFIRANALIQVQLLHTSPNADVIVGSDQMLFYTDSVADFEGTAPLQPDELECMRKNIARLAMSLEQQGARLYIAIAPNKNTVYPEAMPDAYPRRNDGGNIPLLAQALKGTGAEIIELVPPLVDAKGAGKVYFNTDTHWNERGAYAAAQVILAQMGKADLFQVERVEGMDYSGDLARMVGLSSELTERTEHLAEGNDWGETPDYSARHLDVSRDGDGTLLMLRDSFGNHIAPFLAPAYEMSELRWENPFDATHAADDVLILIAERNIRLYLLQAPLCLAPAVDAPTPATTAPCALEVYEDEGLVHFEFRFDAWQTLTDCYLSLDGQTYWASPIPADPESEQGWYQALLPPDALDSQAEIRAIGVTSAAEAFEATEPWVLGDLIEIFDEPTPDDEEEMDDYEQLQQLRRQLAEEG